MLDSEGSCGIMGVDYSTHGLKDTSHLKTTRLIGFMRNYGHELLNSRTSWVFRSSLECLGSKRSKGTIQKNSNRRNDGERVGADDPGALRQPLSYWNSFLAHCWCISGASRQLPPRMEVLGAKSRGTKPQGPPKGSLRRTLKTAQKLPNFSNLRLPPTGHRWTHDPWVGVVGQGLIWPASVSHSTHLRRCSTDRGSTHGLWVGGS
uniref:Uncharacterized protein n=1 Tax=Solanum tuberosum TaxID=4113 RepID=M1DQB3_SOLTU